MEIKTFSKKVIPERIIYEEKHAGWACDFCEEPIDERLEKEIGMSHGNNPDRCGYRFNLVRDNNSFSFDAHSGCLLEWIDSVFKGADKGVSGCCFCGRDYRQGDSLFEYERARKDIPKINVCTPCFDARLLPAAINSLKHLRYSGDSHWGYKAPRWFSSY